MEVGTICRLVVVYLVLYRGIIVEQAGAWSLKISLAQKQGEHEKNRYLVLYRNINVPGTRVPGRTRYDSMKLEETPAKPP